MTPSRRLGVEGCLCVVALVLGAGGAGAANQPQLPGWVQTRLAQVPGPNVYLTLGTSDHAIGQNRVSFLVARPNGQLVTAPQATVLIAREGASKGFKETARLVSLLADAPAKGRPAGRPDVTRLYVTNLRLSEPGRYWLVVEPRGVQIQAVGTITVRRDSLSPRIGSKAIASNNPTLADAPAAKITTARPPDRTLLGYSIAGSLAAHKAFVVAFATPAFCESRTCGPVVQTLQAAQKRFTGTGIRFIHVEVYKNNNPDLGINRWMSEWHLPSEPWVFLVDRQGIIRAKFEGAMSLPELERAIRAHLLGRK